MSTNIDGVHTVELSPIDLNSSLDLNFSIKGSGITTFDFNESFYDISKIISYEVKRPEFLSSPLSNWAVGRNSNFQFYLNM